MDHARVDPPPTQRPRVRPSPPSGLQICIAGAADSHIAPVLSQLCEFVQSFDNPNLDGYRTVIISRVKAIESLQKHGLFSRAFPV